jgi:hypothetical protein
MGNHRFAKFFSLILIFTYLIAPALTVSGQRRKAKPATPAATSGGGPAVQFVPGKQNTATAEAFKSGTLPQAARMPDGTPEQQAAELARQVFARDGASTAALMAAILASGFGIREKDGAVLTTVKPGQGLAFDEWEIASIAKMYGEGRTAPLGDIRTLLASKLPQLSQAPVAEMLLKDIRRHAGSGGKPELKFWANFIIALGECAGDSTSLGKSSAKDARVDAVQNAFIMRRLAGDLLAVGETKKVADATRERSLDRQTAFVNASWSNEDARLFRDASISSGTRARSNASASHESIALVEGDVPCKLQGDEGTVMDASALMISTAYGELMGYLSEHLSEAAGEALEKYSAFAGVANLVLSYAKFVQTYAALETRIEMEGGGPLIRTKNATPGGRKNFRATTRMNIGNWQVYNCLRLALTSTAGIDFSVMNDGPLGGVTVTWHLDQGGAGDVYSNRTGLTGNEQIVGIVNHGPRIQDAGSYAGIEGGKGSRVGNAVRTKTDDNGVATVTVEGTPQRNAKIGKLITVMKKATLRTTVRMKGGDIKGDGVDVISQAMAGVTGLITMPAELLYRSDWASTASLTFDVQDWQDCDGGWFGTVTYGYSDSSNYGKSFEKGHEKGERSETVNAEIKLNGNERATANVTANYRDYYEKEINDTECCYFVHSGKCKRTGRDVLSDHRNTVGTGQATIDVDGGVRVYGDSYMLEIGIPEIGGTQKTSRTYTHIRECNGVNQPNGNSESSGSRGFSVGQISATGKIDPNNPDVISGSKTDGKVTITWSLHRCR